VTEPRDLTDLMPADVRTELAAAVAALELHGPAVTKALRRLDQATTAAW
jgi:ABC-type transporter Mla subunit MlaD